ncbi:hypothetical protein K466DRAFT_585456 [Polyporus arcularius HHB13444]|uniref:NAD(P)-binding domain-containing protein n=1 Tax=Polyporus arcularius HHB13444 TaxID=1314778 RepID=A0A5C3PI22_9APHY|nr:hypothetical protein K466DRAFT_585456 [Polyporus arcularius HHB13444]
MRIVLTGVTGVAGLTIYRAALTDPAVQQVTLLTRREVPSWAKLPANAHEKTEVILHSDFKTYPPDLARRLAGHDALIWALGRSAVGMSEEEYTELTYDYTLSAARALKEAGAGSTDKPFRFVYLSGENADPTGKSGQMWARVKGRVERELPELFEGTNITAHIYRPGYFFPSKKYPEDRRNQRSTLLRVADVALGPAVRGLIPSHYSPIEDLGRFVVEVAKGRWPQQTLFRNADMRELVKSVPPLAEPKHDEL